LEPALVDAERPKVYTRLYSPWSVAGTALLGGVLAGFLLLGTNFRKLKRPVAAWAASAIALVGVVAITLCVIWDSDVASGISGLGFVVGLFVLQLIGAAVVVGLVAFVWQRRAFAAHLAAGGKAASLGEVRELCLVASALVFLVQLGLTYPFFDLGAIEFGNSAETITYRNGATRKDALRLGNAFTELGVFDGHHRKTVDLERKGDGYEVTVYIRTLGMTPLGPQRDLINEPNLHAAFSEFPGQLSQRSFSGKPVILVIRSSESGIILTTLLSKKSEKQ
jgi:hypothetical protein